MVNERGRLSALGGIRDTRSVSCLACSDMHKKGEEMNYFALYLMGMSFVFAGVLRVAFTRLAERIERRYDTRKAVRKNYGVTRREIRRQRHGA